MCSTQTLRIIIATSLESRKSSRPLPPHPPPRRSELTSASEASLSTRSVLSRACEKPRWRAENKTGRKPRSAWSRRPKTFENSTVVLHSSSKAQECMLKKCRRLRVKSRRAKTTASRHSERRGLEQLPASQRTSRATAYYEHTVTAHGADNHSTRPQHRITARGHCTRRTMSLKLRPERPSSLLSTSCA